MEVNCNMYELIIMKNSGSMYHGCVTAGFDKPWCSTATDFFGNHIQGNWGDCDQNTCPIKSS